MIKAIESLFGKNKRKDHRFKFVDDASVLEIVNLLSIGIASHNCKQQVPSNIHSHNQFIHAEYLKSQQYLETVHQWSEDNLMELNIEKSKNMIFNFTYNYQFSTDISHHGNVLETVEETKLLGTIITSDLKWHKNTEYLVKKANARMRILHKISEFNAPREDLTTIYISYVRSILEQSCQVWHSSLTQEDTDDLERVQKSALKVILKEDYKNYDEALDTLMLCRLSERREKMCLKFAKNCEKNELTKDLFPLNPTSGPGTRSRDKYQVLHTNTDRLKDSAVPYLQRLLNKKK